MMKVSLMDTARSPTLLMLTVQSYVFNLTAGCLLVFRLHNRQGIGYAKRKIEIWNFAERLQFVGPGL